MVTSRPSLIKNWIWFGMSLLVVSFALFFASVPSANAQSSSSLTLIQSDTSRVVLELTISGYDSSTVTVSGVSYSSYSIADLGRTDEPGKPALPVTGAMVGIPPGAQATLKIVDDQSQTVAELRHPLPVPTTRIQTNPRRPYASTVNGDYRPNAATYSANQFYPASSAKIGSTGDWRSQHYLTVQFYPLQYNPVTRQLLFHRRLRVEITFSYPRGQSPQTLGSTSNEGAFEQTLQNAIINYSSAKNWRSASVNAPARRAVGSGTGKCPDSTITCYRIGIGTNDNARVNIDGLNTDGIYKVTCGSLALAAGKSLTVTANQLQVFKNGTEQAIKVVGNGWANGSCTSSDSSDYLLFFGQALPADSAKYTSTNTYWLTYDNVVTGSRITTRSGTPLAGTKAESFTRTIHLEQNKWYGHESPYNEEGDHWYWDVVVPGAQATYAFTPQFFTTTLPSAALTFDLVGTNTPVDDLTSTFSPHNHKTRLEVNSCPRLLDDVPWSGYRRFYTTTDTFPYTNTVSFPSSCVFAGNALMTDAHGNVGTNMITVTELTGDSADTIYTNFFDIAYQSTFDAISDTIRFRQTASGRQYELNNFDSSSIELYDITNPSILIQITPTIPGGGPPYSLQFADSASPPREYLALTTAKTPSSIVLDSPSNLQNSNNAADYLIISPASFISALNPLTTTRNLQFPGRVKVVDVQDVYDEFNDGVVDPQAIHDFLQCTFQNTIHPTYTCNKWQASPQYVLLVGAGTFDPKGYCLQSACGFPYQTAPNTTLIPPYLRMVDPFDGETVSDNCLVAFSGTCSLSSHPLADMFMGRLPADNTSDVAALVAKIVNYENPPFGNWRDTSAFVTDNAFDSVGVLDAGGNFFAFSEALAADPTYYPTRLSKDRIYYNPCIDTDSHPQCFLPFPSYSNSSDAHDTIISSINSGRLIVNYIGHGGIDQWAEESLFRYSPNISPDHVNDLALLRPNGNKTPVMLELTCRTGYFIYPHSQALSLAKSNVNLAGKGAVASWAATGQGLGGNHDLLEKGFFEAALNQGIRRLGPAIQAGKAKLSATGSDTDLLDTTLLLGDPASSLALQWRLYFPFVAR